MQNYYNEVEKIIIERESNKRVREIVDNEEDVLSRWNIGRLIIEAQGGENRAKYGSSLIKEWGKRFSEKYGMQYSRTNLMYMRQFYLIFPNVHSLRGQLNWTHYRKIITIKNENERNYYINQVILNNLSSRELDKLFKSKSFERLSYADRENVKLIEDKNDTLITIKDIIKDPILINAPTDLTKLDEVILHKYIINMLEDRFLELGVGFALIGHEYKILINNRAYKIDLLFFNYELNSFIVLELKIRELKVGDKEQVNFYVNYVDKNLRKEYMNKTIGILLVKKNNKFVLEYATNDDIFVTTYKLLKEGEKNAKLLQ